MTRSPLLLLALLAGCSSAGSPGADAAPDLVGFGNNSTAIYADLWALTL